MRTTTVFYEQCRKRERGMTGKNRGKKEEMREKKQQK